MKRALFLFLAALPAWTQYAYYFSDSFSSINTSNWQANGVISGDSPGWFPPILLADR